MRCPHCGRDRSECSDPAKVWYPQRTVCFATMEREEADAKYARLHEKRPWHDGTFSSWAAEPARSHPYRYNMGVTIGVADVDLHPTDDFLTEERAPWPPPDAEEG